MKKLKISDSIKHGLEDIYIKKLTQLKYDLIELFYIFDFWDSVVQVKKNGCIYRESFYELFIVPKLQEYDSLEKRYKYIKRNFIFY